MRPIALLALAVPFALVACGAESSDALDEAVAGLEQASTARIAFYLDGKPSGDGVLDASTGRAHLTLDLPTTEGLDLDSYQMVFDGRELYMEVGFLVPKLEGKWLRAEDLDRGQLQPFQNPKELLGVLREAAENMEEKGSERVRGVETTRYDGTILQSKIDGFEGRDDTPNRFSIWVDGNGLARRLSLDDRKFTRQTHTIEYYDFGAPVTVALPPAEDVITEAEFDRACDESSDDKESLYCFSGDGVGDSGEIEEVE